MPKSLPPSHVDVDLITKIESLRDRLRDAEFQSSARSQELILLKTKLSAMVAEKTKRTNTSNRTENSNRIFFNEHQVLQLPSIYDFMPHLMDSPNSLKPAIHVTKDRQGGMIVIQ